MFILIFLLINIALYGFQNLSEEKRYEISNERIAQMSSVLNRNGLVLYSYILPDYYPMNRLELEAPTADKEAMNRRIFGDEVPETRMENVPVRERLFTKDQSLTFYYGEQKGLVYYEGSSDKYIPKDLTISSVDDVAKAFAKDLFGDGVDMEITYRKTADNTYRIEMNEKYKERLILQSYIKMTISESGIEEALAIRYNPSEFIGTKENVYPFDEVVYSLMYYLEEESNSDEPYIEKRKIKDIDIGYYIIDQDMRKLLYQVEPYYRVIFDTGEIYYINAFTNSIYKP